MKKLCADFDHRVAPLGFAKSGSRLWSRENGSTVEHIHLHRRGSSYGAPRNASVDIRVELSIETFGAPRASDRLVFSDDFRKPDGYAYHHRFNAQTWSTYERCLDELSQFIVEVAEPWFQGRQA